MKTFQTVLIVVIFMISGSSCASTTSLISEINRDGSSLEQAIKVKSVRAEYQWIAEHYPGYTTSRQALIFEKRKPYDLLTIVSPSGEEKEIWFDISTFFGKGF